MEIRQNLSEVDYDQHLDIWFRVNNISREKLDLFRDFIVGLHQLIEKTYLGVDAIKTERDQRGHFDWCWNKTIESFSKERIYFKETGNHQDYLWYFFQKVFYNEHGISTKEKINNYLSIIFSFDRRKDELELNSLSELYKFLNQNFKK